jgi:predicted murein hydrolase (TIGR00659 family)
MREMLLGSAFFAVVLTLLCYQIGLWIKGKVKTPIANPLLIATIIIIGVLLLLDVDYETYREGTKFIDFLLTPATVCLAIPLYRQLELLKKYPIAIFGGVAAGVLTTMVSITALSLVFGLNDTQFVTLLPKSITTAIGMGISEKMGGIVTITVVSISITGITGACLSPYVLKLCRIKEPIARGLAIGTASHALGTTKAMELGEIEGAMSSLSIVVTGLLTVIVIPFVAKLPFF